MFYYNASGSLKDIKEVYYNASGSLKTVKEIWYNANGSLKLVWPDTKLYENGIFYAELAKGFILNLNTDYFGIGDSSDTKQFYNFTKETAEFRVMSAQNSGYGSSSTNYKYKYALANLRSVEVIDFNKFKKIIISGWVDIDGWSSAEEEYQPYWIDADCYLHLGMLSTNNTLLKSDAIRLGAASKSGNEYTGVHKSFTATFDISSWTNSGYLLIQTEGSANGTNRNGSVSSASGSYNCMIQNIKVER